MAAETEILPPRYHSPRRIGHGGMREIFLATDETLEREVAVKVLAERYARDEAIRNRFTREALAAARLSGEPGAVTIFDVGEWRGRPFIVMEHLGGGSLDDRLREEGAQDPGAAVAWLEQAATALDAGHRLGVVHRDVKPANLLLDIQGKVHVADFGIASAAGLDSLTLTGTVLGTAGYLAPEQAQGKRAGPASDLYALAVVAYELLSGHRPFESDSPTAEATAHVNAPVPSISERCEHLPGALDEVFRRALSKDPGSRFGTATELVGALRAALSPPTEKTAATWPGADAPTRPIPRPVSTRRSGLPGGVVLSALLLLGAAVVGGVVAAMLTGGGHNAVRVRTVVEPGGRTTTVQETITRRQSTSVPPPPPQVASSGGHSLNDRGYALIQQGDYSGAVPLLQQAVTKLQGTGPADPYEGYANYNLGYTLYRSAAAPRRSATYSGRSSWSPIATSRVRS